MSFASFSEDITLRSCRISNENAERQARTAKEILSRLDRQPGIILADEVGMGKTYVALAVAASVALEHPSLGPVVVMHPPALKDKWPKDWRTFQNEYLPGNTLRFERAHSGTEFLSALHAKPHLIFLTHGAFNRSLRDGFMKLALVKRAFKGTRSFWAQRRAFEQYAARLLRMDARIGRSDLLRNLLDCPYEDWPKAIARSGIESLKSLTDPLPRPFAEALDKLDGEDVAGVRSALRRIPLRESVKLDERLQVARHELNDAMKRVWEQTLNNIEFSSPLLILDEAHHVKNPDSKLASLFVDEVAAEETDKAGPLGGRFARMLFLTATPFQLGHQELLNVLARFEGVKWNGGLAPEMTRDDFKRGQETLEKLLTEAQRAALRLDRRWGQLSSSDICDSAGNRLDVDTWWHGLETRTGGDAVPSIVEQVNCTEDAMKAAEEKLRPWVLRHLKPRCLPNGELRRRELPGAAIRDNTPLETGLKIDPVTLLPFLLAGRAQALVAKQNNGRALFAEGLASSFEAYLETRNGRHDIEDDAPPQESEPPAEAAWYLKHIDKALEDPRTRAAHPKIQATVNEAVRLWWAGEKVLIFCHYRATGRALREHISKALHETITDHGAQRVARGFLSSGSSALREVTDELARIIGPSKLPEQARIVKVVLRFIRTPSFLVRYFPLDPRNRAVEDFISGFDKRLEDGLSLRQKIKDFCLFLKRSGAEREEYLAALETTQPGSHFARRDYFHEEEQTERATLLANVRLANGAVDSATRRRLLLTFNTPLFPEILIASSVLSEGVDLHLSCRHVIHHDLSWNPSSIEQRTGRIDRIGSRAERLGKPIHVYLPYVAATQDEKMYRVVRDRERWFQIVMGDKYELGEAAADRLAERVPLPATVQQRLVFQLSCAQAAAATGSD